VINDIGTRAALALFYKTRKEENDVKYFLLQRNIRQEKNSEVVCF
jgi:hypothetical protein